MRFMYLIDLFRQCFVLLIMTPFYLFFTMIAASRIHSKVITATLSAEHLEVAIEGEAVERLAMRETLPVRLALCGFNLTEFELLLSSPGLTSNGRIPVGATVTVTPGYASCGDASDGPLGAGDKGVLVKDDRDHKPYKVRATSGSKAGSEWWYQEDAICLAAVAASAPATTGGTLLSSDVVMSALPVTSHHLSLLLQLLRYLAIFQ